MFQSLLFLVYSLTFAFGQDVPCETRASLQQSFCTFTCIDSANTEPFEAADASSPDCRCKEGCLETNNFICPATVPEGGFCDFNDALGNGGPPSDAQYEAVAQCFQQCEENPPPPEDDGDDDDGEEEEEENQRRPLRRIIGRVRRGVRRVVGHVKRHGRRIINHVREKVRRFTGSLSEHFRRRFGRNDF